MGSPLVRHAFQMVVCTFMIFVLSTATGSIMISMPSHPNALAEDNLPSEIFPEDNAITVEPSDDGSFIIRSPEGISPDQIPQGILNEIVKTITQENDADAQDANENSSNENDENSLLRLMNTVVNDDSKTAISTDNLMLSSPSPTPAPPTVEDDVHSTDTPEPETINTKVHFKITVTDKSGDDKGSDTTDAPTKSLWTSTLPILLNNNKASLFSKPDFDDMSKVLPDLPSFMDTLNKFHKPGHVTVMIMNPKHMSVDKKAVKKSNICCEMRHHFLVIPAKKDIPSDDEQASSFSSPDDVIPPELQSFLRSLLHNSAEDDSPMPPSVDDHDDSNDNDSPWNDKEKSLVSHIMDNLHLFDQPGHLSAISFHPRHIVQKKNPRIFHIRMRIPEPKQEKPDSSDLINSLFNSGNGLQNLVPEDQDTDSQNALHPTKNKLKVRVIHRNGRTTVHEYPLDNFSGESFGLPAFSSPVPKQKAPKKKKVVFYYIHHPQKRPQPSVTPNIQTILKNFFNDDSYASQPTTDPIKEILSQFFGNDNSGMSDFFGEPEAEDSPQSISPLDILNQLTSQDRHYPQDIFSDQGNFLSEVNSPPQQHPTIHITQMRIVPMHPSDDNDLTQFMA